MINTVEPERGGHRFRAVRRPTPLDEPPVQEEPLVIGERYIDDFV